jgi:hypothetical protein
MALNIFLVDTNHQIEATVYDESLNSANLYVVQNSYLFILLSPFSLSSLLPPFLFAHFFTSLLVSGQQKCVLTN